MPSFLLLVIQDVEINNYMYKHTTALLLAAALSGSVVAQENSQTIQVNCEETAAIFSILRGDYKEEPLVAGRVINAGGYVMSVWSNKDSGSWTLLVSNGPKTCIIAAGMSIRIMENATKSN